MSRSSFDATADLDALRALDLPAPRLAYLSRLILAAPSPADRQRILLDAEREAKRNAYKGCAAVQKAYDEQKAGDH